MSRLLYWLSGYLRVRFIDPGGIPYLERYYVGRWLGVTAYLHRFVSSDDEPHVHDHPWFWALALVLCGHYREERVIGLCPDYGWLSRYRRMSVGRINAIRAHHFHRIVAARLDTWTLFVHGPHAKGWGFLKHLKSTDPQSRCVLYHQPLDTESERNWQLTAPRGRDSLRLPPLLHRRRCHASNAAAR